MGVLRENGSNCGLSIILKLSLKKKKKLYAQNSNDTSDIIHAIIRFFFSYDGMLLLGYMHVSQKEKKMIYMNWLN